VNLSTRLSTLPTEIKAAAGRRWRLFPVEAEGKQPLVKEWQTIATLQLGLSYRQGFRLFVIDVDGPKGRAALEELASQGLMLPETLAVTTGWADSGEHRYYRIPTGVDIRNDQNGKIAPTLTCATPVVS
jgi:hypothetical protein